MAMLISKFHKLIQSKLLWGFFLFIVVMSFVVWGTVTPQTSKQAEGNSPGKLHGKPVEAKVFRDAYFNTYLSVILASGRAINITREIDTQLRQAAWERIVTLEEARKLGISSTDDEVAQSIQANPAFKTQDGQFNLSGYRMFVDNFLSSLGFTERMFEEHMREEIVMQKMRVVVNSSALVSPFEIRRTFNSLSDRFKIAYAELDDTLVRDQVKVTREDAKTFFDKDPAAFTIPELAQVKYVRFAAAPFVAKAHVTEEDARQFYDDNLDAFLRDTNTLAAATNALEEATNSLAATRYEPFEEVKQKITNTLLERAALDMAADRALEFVTSLAEDREGNAMSFEDAAKAFEVVIEQPAPFSARQPPAGIESPMEFARATFALGSDTTSYFSDPIRGSNFVYVVAMEKRIPERIPTFEEVADEVLPIAEQQALSDALGTKAKEVRDAAEKAVGEGKSFADAVKEFGLAAVETEEFSASRGLTNDFNEIILRGVLPRNQGEVTDLLPTFNSILIAHIIQRTPADLSTLDSLKPQIEASIRRQHGRFLFDDWQQYLLKAANFEERQAAAPVEEELEQESDGQAPAENQS